MSEHDEREDYDDEPSPRSSPEALVATIASHLQVYGAFQVVLGLVGVWTAAKTVVEAANQDLSAEVIQRLLINGLFAATAFGSAVVILMASHHIPQFRRYRLAVAAGVLTASSLPLVFCAVVTVPLGVWTLIVLRRPDVRAGFEAVVR
ncbi:MAG: hypothetical protein J2P46_22480, partial [Zavarzinella sp.]|nr:hypothetical protein [Zavarzinella sp.]